MFGPVLADEQRRALLPVPLPHRFAVGGGPFDSLHGLGHARVGLCAVRGDLARPFRETVSVRRGGAPLLADVAAQRLGAFGRGLVLGTGLASAEPAHRCEAATGDGLVRDGIEIGRTVTLGPDSEWLGDLAAYLLGGGFGLAERGGALVVLSTVRGALGVELRGSLRPPLC